MGISIMGISIYSIGDHLVQFDWYIPRMSILYNKQTERQNELEITWSDIQNRRRKNCITFFIQIQYSFSLF